MTELDVYVVATRPFANKISGGRFYFTLEEAMDACDELVRSMSGVPEGAYKVYKAYIRITREAKYVSR
jgi:hypothetical protein